ncbi:carboxypeptidase S1 [Russula decolorans]
MLLHSVLITIYALPALIRGKQIPVVDGVIGGVPSPDDCKFEIPKRPFSNNALAPGPTPGKLRGVVENSGVCGGLFVHDASPVIWTVWAETTRGVYQASGYGDVNADKSIWFWFFAARTNPNTAPLITWFNGGPGSSSMVGLFKELGPCRINNQSTGVDLNPTSWTNVANVPDYSSTSLSELAIRTEAKPSVRLSKPLSMYGSSYKYGSRIHDSASTPNVILESGRNHMVDTMALHSQRTSHYVVVSISLTMGACRYFLQQNAAIRFGTLKGIPINLKVLGIGNGLTDPLSQYPGYIQYAQSNPYHPLVNSSVIATANTAWSQAGGCRDQIIACNNVGSNAVCSAAQSFCNSGILYALPGIWDLYYVLTANPDPYPPKLEPYLNDPAVTSKIGSQTTWVETNFGVSNQFATTGDWIRSSSSNLELVINAGVRTVIYDGDADYICNYMGVEAMVASLKTVYSPLYALQNFSTYNVNGKPAGLYKNAGKLSYLRVSGAGHEVPAYLWRSVPRGAAALQMFTQIMSGHPLSST